MGSEMTTAEMVDFLKSIAKQRVQTGDLWASRQYAAMADRLEALDNACEKARPEREKWPYANGMRRNPPRNGWTRLSDAEAWYANGGDDVEG